MNKKENKEGALGIWSMTKPTLAYVFKTAFKYKKSVFLLYGLRFVASALGEVKMLLLPKLLVDELVLIGQGAEAGKHIRSIVLYVALTVSAELISRVLGNIADSKKNYYRTYFEQKLNYILCEKSMEMDFQYTEDPEVLDQQNKAKEGISWYSGGVLGILDCVYSVFYNLALMLTSITIIALYCPLLIPVQILGMGAVYYFNYLNQKINTEFFLKLAKSNRLFGYVFYELASFSYGKDIRLYNSQDMMCERAEKYSDNQIGIWKEQALLMCKNNYLADTANALRDGISYFYMGYRTLKKLITLGDFSMCVSSASRLYQSLMGIGSGLQETSQKCSYAYQFLKYLDYPDALQKGNEKVKAGDHLIEFRDVSFKYPRTEEYVLEHINIKINPKERLSIVGLNGAGKTTFIKLLCRLYDVTEGEILIDGINIKDYSKKEYRKLFAVVFQDFQLFAFSLKDNIAMGDVDRSPSDVDIENTLKLSGLYEDAVKLDNGTYTLLFKNFDEKGTELSGGQKQKTAISRALYKNAPIVILDEPTAALDPVAEYEIYKKFDTLVSNKSAIYISHRLSSCKFCDRIAVFSDKTIKEYGTHSELVNLKNGIYANMFRTQSQYYAESVS